MIDFSASRHDRIAMYLRIYPPTLKKQTNPITHTYTHIKRLLCKTLASFNINWNIHIVLLMPDYDFDRDMAPPFILKFYL